MVQPVDECLFLLGELVGLLGVDGREVAGAHLVFFSVHDDGSFLVVDGVEQAAVIHFP